MYIANGAFKFCCLSSILLEAAFLLSCGGNEPKNSSGGMTNQQAASVTVTLSDPVVCSASLGGPFQHIYVTISDVRVFAGATPPFQNGIDLTPGLNQSPVQVDLLGTAGAGCILATLGSSVSVPPGMYQAMQVFFLGSAQVSRIKGGTKCPNTTFGPAANCAVLADGSAISLDLATTEIGVSIPGVQIALTAGTQALNIDFDSCASMVLAYAGDYGMDPTMHAALMPTAGSITGKILDAGNQQPIAGDLIVALEQTDSSGVDREIMQTAPGPDGSFVLCPLPPGTYDLVAVAVSEGGVSYAATITTGVQPGSSLNVVPLHAVAGANQSAATIMGQVTAAGPSQAAGFTQLVISALQNISLNGSSVRVTIPLPSQYTSALRTSATGSANYVLFVPAGNPWVGAFVPNGGTTYTTQPVNYDVDAQSSCNPSTGQTPQVSVSSGSTSPAPTIALADARLHSAGKVLLMDKLRRWPLIPHT